MGSHVQRGAVAGTHTRKSFGNYYALDADGNVLLPVICECDKMVLVPRDDVFEGRTLPCPDTVKRGGR